MSWAKVAVLCLSAPVGVGLGLIMAMKPKYEVGTKLCYSYSGRESWEPVAPVEKYVVLADGESKMLLRSLDDGSERTHWKTSDYSVCE